MNVSSASAAASLLWSLLAAQSTAARSATTATPAANAEMDVSAFIQQLALRYADMAASSQSGNNGATSSTQGSLISTSA